MVLPALKMGGYTYRTQVKMGVRPGGRPHVIGWHRVHVSPLLGVATG